MTHPSKIKGNTFEREIVNQLREAGIAAHRVPLSGAVSGYEGDLRVEVGGLLRKAECKRRRRAFGTLSAHLGTNDFLCVRDDRSPALMVMTIETFIALARELNHYRDEKNAANDATGRPEVLAVGCTQQDKTQGAA
jgi:hypothetical protein